MAKSCSVDANKLKQKFTGRIFIFYGEFDPPPFKTLANDLFESLKGGTLSIELTLQVRIY
jgi:hypothetical protein